MFAFGKVALLSGFFAKKKKVEGILGGLGLGRIYFFSLGEHSCFGLKSCIWCCSKAMEGAGIKLWLAYTGLLLCFNDWCLFCAEAQMLCEGCSAVTGCVLTLTSSLEHCELW